MRTERETMRTGRGVSTARRRRLFAWLLPFTLLAGVVSGSTPAHATFPGSSGSIAFMRVVGNGTQQLFTIEPDGSNEQQLTDFPTASIEDPDWSPDGSKIAFGTDLGGNVHIYVVNADGSGLTQITSGDGFESAPSWSPDGTEMAIDAAEPGLPEGIFIVDVSTGGLTQVTANPYGIFDTSLSTRQMVPESRSLGSKSSNRTSTADRPPCSSSTSTAATCASSHHGG